MDNSELSKLYGDLDRKGDIFRQKAVATIHDRELADQYGRDLSPYIAPIDALLDLTTYSSTDVIVDLGCGTAISTERILQRNPKTVIAIDFSEHMIQEAKKKGLKGVIFKEGSAESLADLVESANKVICVNSFQYFEDSDAVLKAVHKVLEPNGELLFNEPIMLNRAVIYNPLLRATEIAFHRVFREKTYFTDEVIKYGYGRADFEDMAVRNGFTIKQYFEYPDEADQGRLKTFHASWINDLASGLEEKVGKERTQHIVRDIRNSMVEFYRSMPRKQVIGKEALVCMQVV